MAFWSYGKNLGEILPLVLDRVKEANVFTLKPLTEESTLYYLKKAIHAKGLKCPCRANV